MPVISTIAAATARAFGAFKAAAGGAADEFFNYVTLLLHGDGTNGAQNNTFLDSSTNNFTITRNGNTTQGTFSPFSQDDGKWGAYFDGTGDYLQATDASAFDLSNFDWCFECWAYIQGTGTQTLLSLTDTGASAGSNAVLSIQYVGSTSKITWSTGSSSGISNQTITSTNTFSTNQFLHVAAVRDGATITLYVNGANEGTYNVSTGTFNAGRDFLYIGNRRGNSGLTDYLTGYLSNVRVVINAPVYTAPFTPSTTPLTAITNTSLLTCQSNRFVDNSANAFAITVNGNTSIQPFSPFAPSAAYSAAVNGGSGYFDGSGDYLTAPDNAAWDFGTSDFTIETWIYPTTSGIVRVIGSAFSNSGNDGWSFELTAGNLLTFYAEGSYRVTSSGTVSANSWNHVAVSRSGTSLRLFINGVADGSVSNSTNISGSTSALTISSTPTGTQPFTGYQSNFRIVTGTAVYTSAFTPPTSPVTAISGTSLLTNFTNAGILDNTGRNNLETLGNAQISTSVKKFGTGSLAFDGTGDYLVMSNPITFIGDFTFELWFNPNEANYYPSILVVSGALNSLGIYNGSSGKGFIGNTDASTVTRTNFNDVTFSIGTFYHIAFVRSSGVIKVYVDGVADSTTLSNSANSQVFTRLATHRNSADGINGYIDDLRITKGVARYTSAFTPPTAAFPDL